MYNIKYRRYILKTKEKLEQKLMILKKKLYKKIFYTFVNYSF